MRDSYLGHFYRRCVFTDNDALARDAIGVDRLQVDAPPMTEQLQRVRLLARAEQVDRAMPFSTWAWCATRVSLCRVSCRCVRVGCLESQVKRSGSLQKRGVVPHWTERHAPFKNERGTVALLAGFAAVRASMRAPAGTPVAMGCNVTPRVLAVAKVKREFTGEEVWLGVQQVD